MTLGDGRPWSETDDNDDDEDDANDDYDDDEHYEEHVSQIFKSEHLHR